MIPFTIRISLFLAFLACVSHAQEFNPIDPSGTWTNEQGTLSLLLTGDALSFSYSSVFGATAHLCSGAGVAGLEADNIYHFVDEQGTVAFEINRDSIRLRAFDGIPAFCGAGWQGETYTRAGFTAPRRCRVKAKRSRFRVVMPSPPWERKAYVVAGNVVDVVPAQHDGATRYVLARYRGKRAVTVGLLEKNTLACP